MKRLLTIFAVLLFSASVQAQINAADGGKLPNQGTEIGGKGTDGKFHFFKVNTSGQLQAGAAQYTGTPSSFSILTADGTVFTLAAGEIGFIQNLSSTVPLAVKYGASASTTSFNFILPTGVADSDGKGGAYRIDNWVGVVSVAAMSGTASYIAWKQSP